MYQILVSGTRFFRTHSILINDPWDVTDNTDMPAHKAKRLATSIEIARGIKLHLARAGYHDCVASIINRETGEVTTL